MAHSITIIKPDPRGVALAVQYLRAGRSVVYPTDTSYGLAVDATNVTAVRRLMKIKERKNQPVHVVVADLKMAKKYAVFDPPAVKLFKKFLPGPLTIVLELKLRPLPQPLPRPGEGGSELGEEPGEVEAFNLLSGGTGTIGIRVPDNRIALKLTKKLGKPITTPSANPSAHLSGGTTPYSAQDSFEQFRHKKYQPDLYLDAGKLRKRKPSTMVSLENGKISMLRKGPISKIQIQRATR